MKQSTIHSLDNPDVNLQISQSRLKKHQEVPLLSALKTYSQLDIAPFDVPGHKRGQGVKILTDYFGSDLMKMDVNSLPQLDNASHPTGVIKKAQDLLADAYHADEAFFITNGTTSAIHCMLLSLLHPGDKVLLPRNIHKSAINGLILCGAIPVYAKTQVTPDGLTGNVTKEEIKKQLEKHPDIKAVFLLNPTYYGHTAKLKDIVSLCHQKDVLVLIDEAHGAHLTFHDQLPDSAMMCGADASCVSIHKTGGALTQASALLINHTRLDAKKVKRVVNLMQSTSCSYLLMSSLDGARQNLVLNGYQQLKTILSLTKKTRERLEQINGITVVKPINGKTHQYDITKLGINVSGLGLTGFEVYELMWKQFNIQLEMPDFNHVLAIISLGDHDAHLNRLVAAFECLSATYYQENHEKKVYRLPYVKPTVKLSPREAYYADKEVITLAESVGRLAGESILAYPPGIPIIAPGELITKEVIAVIESSLESGAFITDSYDESLQTILVIKS